MSPSANKIEISDRYLNKDYLEKTATWHAEDSPWKARQILRILKEQSVSPQTVAEVGCGAGEILLRLAKELPDAEFVGYELSTDAYEICKSKTQTKVSFEFADIGSVDRTYDLLLCIDVFEHVENYIEFLRAIRPKARNHVFHIPLDVSVSTVLRNGMMTARHAVGHLHYFTSETALATLRDAGYDVGGYFYTAPFAADGLPTDTLKSRLASYPRRMLYAMSPSFLSKTIGGCSLMVLTK